MKKIYLIILLFLFAGTSKVFATHIMGMDLSYTCTGNNSYTFTLNFYRDCAGINVAVKYLHLVSKSNNYNKLVKLTEVGSPQNISLVCPSDVNKTTCNGGTITGTQKWVFTATVTLPYYAKDWVFYYDDYARNDAITNLVNPGSDGIRVVDSLDNSAGACVNSPVFTTLPTPYVCNLLQTHYNNGGYDPDGDSLSYQLVAPLDSFGNAVKYVSPFSYTNPLSLDSATFEFSPQSGQMTFTPSGQQVTVTAERVYAYNSAGKIIGYVTRDIEIVVLTCTDETPTASWYYNLSGCYQSASNVVTGCVGHPLSFTIDGTNSNTADSDYMNTDLGTVIPAAVFNTTPGLPNVTGTVTWTPTLADTGTHYFTLTVKDNYCPIFNQQIYTFGITITRGVHAKGTATICKGTSTPLSVTGGTSYVWTPATGLSCSTCSNPIASPSLTTTYIVNGSTSPLVCKTSDTVVVTVDTFQTHAAPHLGAVCIGKSIQLTGSNGNSMTWAPAAGLSCTACSNPVATPTISTNYILTASDNNRCVTTDTAKITVNQLPIVSATSGKSLICFNSIDTLKASGASTYAWSPSTNLSSTSGSPITADPTVTTTYTVTGTNSTGCINTAIVAVNVNAQLIASISSKTNVLCFGSNTGSATVNVSGGKSPYNYAWSPSGGNAATANALAAGTYTVTVTDANNCVAVASVSISQPKAQVSASITSQSNVLCFGNNSGSATVTATGGRSPYTYSWSPNGGNAATANALTVGTYTVTVTDSGSCTTTASVIIVQPQAALNAAVNNNSQVPVSCFGNNNGSAWVTVSGGTKPYSYSWNTSPVQTNDTAVNLTAGSYTVTVTDGNNCSTSANVTITQPQAPLNASINANSQIPVSCFGNNTGSAWAAISGGTKPYSYSWNTNPVQTSDTAINLSAGSYTVTVTDANNCSTSANVTITQPQAALSASITSQTNVSCFGGAGSAAVTAIGGTAPYKYSWNTTPVQTTDTAINLSTGTYIVTVTDANNCSTSATANISQPAGALSASIIAQTSVSCFGGNNGSALVKAKAGTPPYNYSWNSNPVQTSDSAVNLPAGMYTVMVTDSVNCITTATVLIAQPTAALSASVNSQVPVSCFGEKNGSAWVTVNGGTKPYSYSWNTQPAQTSDTAVNLSAGSYIVNITDSNNCSTSANITITQPQAALSLSITSQTNVSCFGGNNGSALAVANGGTPPYNYTWNTIAGLIGASATNLSAGTYTVTVTDANGCTASTSVTITQPQSALSVSIIAQTNVSCFGGNNGSAIANATGGTAIVPVGGVNPYIYTWNTNPVQTGNTATNLPAGTYTVTATDSNGCTATATVTIGQPQAALSSSIAAQVNVTCFGGAGTASVATIGGTTPYAYSWNTSPVQTTETAINLQAGTYTVTVTDSNGCTATANVTITQPAGALTASIIAQTDVLCFGNSTGAATVLASAGTKPYSYSWNTIPEQTTDTAINMPAGLYTVTVTDAGNCVTTATVDIVQPQAALSAAVVASSATVCSSSPTTLSVSASGGAGGYLYSWSAGTEDTDSIIVNPSVATTYTVTVTDLNNCVTTGTVPVNVNSLPPVAITVGSQVICMNGVDTLKASGAVTYTWTPATGIIGDTTGATITASPKQVITYTVTGTDANGCSNTATTAVNVNKLPFVSLSGLNPTYCYNAAPVELSGFPPAVPPNGTYSGNGTYKNQGDLFSPDSAGVGGPYTITYTYINDTTGCKNSASLPVTILAAPNVVVSPDSPAVCSGIQVTLQASGANSYSWSPSTGLSATSGSSVISSTTNTIIYTVTGTDTDGCSNSVSTNVTVNALPDVIVLPVTPNICLGNSITLTASGGTTYAWSPSTGLSCASCSSTVANPISTTQYIVVVNNGRCSASDTITVGVFSTNVKAGPDQHILYGSTAQLTASGADFYVWAPGNSLSNDSISDPIASPTVTTTYTVTGSDSLGCTSTDTVVVYVSNPCESLMLPSGFTPSAATNRYFHVLNVGGAELQDFKVFNRWGQMVYETNDITDAGWDGTFNGKEQPMGTYVYYTEILCQGKTVFIKGNVTLIR